MNRRCLLRVLALAPMAGAAGCSTSGGSSNIDLRKITSDVTNIVAGLSALATTPQVEIALLPTALNTLAAALGEAKVVASQLAATSYVVQLSTAKGWVQTLADDVGTILFLVSAVPGLPPQVSAIVVAVQTLLPLVEAAVSLVWTASVKATPMTPAQAREILESLP